LTSPASLVYIRTRRPGCRPGKPGTWCQCTPSARPTNRAAISASRSLWSAGLTTNADRPQVGSAGTWLHAIPAINRPCALGLGQLPQHSLSGAVSVAASRSTADFHRGGDTSAVAQIHAALTSLYAGGQPLSLIGLETLGTLNAPPTLDSLGYAQAQTRAIRIRSLGLGCVRFPC
jgi:hypothetical protein